MPRPAFKLSFQLYTARDVRPREAVLDGLAAIGYDAVEAWLPDYGDDPKGFRRGIDAAGLACLGFHMPFKGLVEETGRFIDIAHAIGDRPLMIPAFLPQRERPDDSDGWKRIGEQLGRGAEKARAAGLRVAWHNHEFEYRLLADGSRPIDHMLSAAGDGVGFEIDFAWVTRGWADPVAELRKFAPRIVAIQLKDTAPPGTLDAENGWRATGDGVVDWATLWPLLRTTEADHLVVEHDRPADWRKTAQRSFDFAVAKGLDR
jgi:sugar phosphate isomerase/epimerase